MLHCCKNGRFTVGKVRPRRKHCSMLIGCPDQVKHSFNYTPVKSSKTTAHFLIGGRGSFTVKCLLRLAEMLPISFATMENMSLKVS